MLRRASIITLFLALFSHAQAQKYTLSGFVKDSANGETVNNALISIKNNKASAISNNYGFFSFTIEKGKYEISISKFTRTCILEASSVAALSMRFARPYTRYRG